MGKKKRGRGQVVRDADGNVVGWKTQWRNPVSKRRETIRAENEIEGLALLAERRGIVRRMRAKLITPDEAAAKLAHTAARPAAYKFSECWRDYVSGGEQKGAAWKKKLAGIYEKRLQKKFGHLAVCEMNFPVMETWVKEVEKPVGDLKRRTVANYFLLIRAAVRYAVKAGRLTSVPWGEFDVRDNESGRRNVGKKRGAAVTFDELWRLVEVAREDDRFVAAHCPGRIPDLTVRLVLMTWLALRRGEAGALRWCDIRRSPSGDYTVEIGTAAREGWASGVHPKMRAAATPDAPTKTGEVRWGAIHSGGLAAQVLEEQRALLMRKGFYREDGPVFPDKNGNFRARDVIRPKKLRSLAARAGLPHPERWVQHSTRHSGCTIHLVAGLPIRDVMALAGHASVQTLEGYMGRASGSVPTHRLDAAMVATGQLPEGPKAPLALPPGPVPEATEPRAVPLPEVHTGHLARAAYDAKYFGRKVASTEVAWEQWLASGAPMEERTRGKATGDAVMKAAPPEVREAASDAGRRARKRREKERPDGWAGMSAEQREPFLKGEQAAYMRGRASALAAWIGKRARLAAEALERGDALPPHVAELAREHLAKEKQSA